MVEPSVVGPIAPLVIEWLGDGVVELFVLGLLGFFIDL